MARIPKNPGLAYAQGREDGEREGIFKGFNAFAYAALIAAYNVADPYMDETQLASFFKEWENECMRVFKDHSENPEELAAALEVETKRLRERMGLDERTDKPARGNNG